jgi:hypothetical protein
MMLANVLDIRTYEAALKGTAEELEAQDLNSIPAKERYEMDFARGRCWDLMDWVFLNFKIFEKESGEALDGFNDVGMRYLAHQVWTIKEFKKEAFRNMKGIGSASAIAPRAVSKQIGLCFVNFLEVPAPDPNSKIVSLAYPFRHDYGVRKLNPPGEHKGKLFFLWPKPCLLKEFFFFLNLVVDNLLELGTTAADERFFQYHRKEED